MKKKLVIVITDMEIELAMFVDATKLTNAREAIAEARDRYYYGGGYRSQLFDDVLSDVMNKYNIEFEIVEHEEM